MNNDVYMLLEKLFLFELFISLVTLVVLDM